MAGADYRLCDVCGGKTFYDANLNYDHKEGSSVRNSGELQSNTSLDYLGDWVVVCQECVSTHEIVLKRKESP